MWPRVKFQWGQTEQEVKVKFSDFKSRIPCIFFNNLQFFAFVSASGLFFMKNTIQKYYWASKMQEKIKISVTCDLEGFLSKWPKWHGRVYVIELLLLCKLHDYYHSYWRFSDSYHQLWLSTLPFLMVYHIVTNCLCLIIVYHCLPKKVNNCQNSQFLGK